jgi:hypothetical protein
MNKLELTKLLRDVRTGKTDVDTAINRLKHLPFEDLGYAHIDHHRHLRQGMPEVIYCQGKTLQQVVGITKRMLANKSDILATRANEVIYEAVKKLDRSAVYHAVSRTIGIQHNEKMLTKGLVLLLTAEASDTPVVEEFAVTTRMLGSATKTIYDVGVANIHRVLSKREILDTARVVVVVSDMDGALPSVIGALVDKPVIVVPTNTGYSGAFQSIASLLSMLNLCASNVAVMNIDNGFGAGVLAHRINVLGEQPALYPRYKRS